MMDTRHRLTVLAAVVALGGLCAAPAAAQGPARLDLHVESTHLSVREIGRFVPALADADLPGQVRITRLDVVGPLDDLAVTIDAGTDGSRLISTIAADLDGPTRTIRGTASLVDFDLAGWLDRPALPSSLTADARVDLTMRSAAGRTRISGDYTLQAPRLRVAGYAVSDVHASGRLDRGRVHVEARATAYGAGVTANGEVSLPAAGTGARYQLHGTVDGLDLRRLPDRLSIPRIASSLRLDYELSGGADALEARAVLAPSVAAGARIARGTTAEIQLRDGAVEYRAQGRVSRLDVQQVAKALALEALSGPRFETSIDAQFTLAGRDRSFELREARLSDSRAFGGRIPAATIRASGDASAWNVSVDGRFLSMDPGRLAGRPGLEGELSAAVVMDARLSRRAGASLTERLSLDGRVTLEPSVVGGMQVDSGTLVGRLDEGALHLDRAEIAGPGLDARLKGVVGLTAAVASHVEYYLDVAHLQTAADLAGRPLHGALTLEGRIDGSDTLAVRGTASGVGVGLGTTSATRVDGQYELNVPRAMPSDARIDARLEAEGVTVGGREIGTLAGTTRYVDRRLTFDGRLTKGGETTEGAGHVIWHPDHQEIHLDRLALTTEGETWRLPEGQTADIRYGGSSIAIDGLRLGAPNRSLAIEGTLGEGGPPLRVQAANLDLSVFDDWIGEPGLRGRLDAVARVQGPLTAPDAMTVEFEVADGAYRGFEYQRLTGRVEHAAGQPLSFDARLRHDAAAWIEASGRLPGDVIASLTGSGRPSTPGVLDVTVRSSPIPLALVQGFTDTFTDVGGVLEINATVTGSLDRPQLAGRVTVRDGAFAVTPLGTRYHGLRATFDLDRDAVHVRELRLRDDDDHTLSASGTLPVRRLAPSTLDVELRADGFEIVDSAVADVELDGGLRVTGTLRSPRIEGTIALSQAIVAVDPFFPPSPEPYAVGPSRPAVAEETIAGRDEAGLLAEVPVALDVRLRIPALSLQGDDLRGPAGSPVGLGNVDVTVGGDLELRKTRDGPLRVTGALQTARGTYEFQGREFTLARDGSISFAGLETANPALSITATRTVSAVEARVHIEGTLDAPRLRLSSNPPLEEADILSLLLFNRPANELGAGEQVALGRRAAAMAAGFVASELTDALDAVVGLGRLDIEASLVDGRIAPALTFGQRFGDLFVEVRQQFGPANPYEFQVEYRVTDWFRIESVLSEGGQEEGGSLLRRDRGSGVDAVFSFER